jgi:hypothetical protein
MRIPVFARGANPRVDRFILKKNFNYCSDQVDLGRADWVDPHDARKGIIAREVLFFGERTVPQKSDEASFNPFFAGGELRGIVFIDPNPARNHEVMRWHWENSQRQLSAQITA